ncbi:hypothetical protein ACJIZ3_025168 [Penstemon smallii]|uniref:Uncharacterized protein n=1 Tax=Penstemon smallii TaxID=265156 RepID=A0ABD3TWH7_9LAMI
MALEVVQSESMNAHDSHQRFRCSLCIAKCNLYCKVGKILYRESLLQKNRESNTLQFESQKNRRTKVPDKDKVNKL